MMKTDPKTVKRIILAMLISACCQGYAAPAVPQFDPPTAGSTLREVQQQMERFLFEDGSVEAQGYVPPSA